MTAIMWDHEPVLSVRTPAARTTAGRTTAGRTTTRRVPEVRAADGRAQGGHLRLTRRGRLTVWLVAAAAGAGVVLSAQAAGADSPAAAQPVVTHVVAPGETLWEIAGGVAAPGQDRRDVVADLVQLNALGGAELQVGQQILVPQP
ncbi:MULTISPECIES: LysM peptidoglycan-binding domain-containing protein [unclassified Actinotalea]|uniref:LysM peptidoglycan-binding domain-containing protein n=1 Tax=unclassified Actinotalea TaxID=2638618 RepID=UPI0015F74599|nr:MULTISPECIES: LysM peptidoglycan-binding domain-containing protein [unclassified Actinotalea]